MWGSQAHLGRPGPAHWRGLGAGPPKNTKPWSRACIGVEKYRRREGRVRAVGIKSNQRKEKKRMDSSSVSVSVGVAAAAAAQVVAVFTDTNLGTHFAMSISPHITVPDFKSKDRSPFFSPCLF